MKKCLWLVLVLFILGLVIIGYSRENVNLDVEQSVLKINTKDTTEAEIFTPEDTRVLGIKLDMEKDEVEKILGQPEKIESRIEADVNVFIYYYEFGEVLLEPLDDTRYTVSMIDIKKSNYKGPRNIKVGDDIESIMHKFPYKRDGVIDDYGHKYLYGKNGSNCGLLIYEAGKITDLIYHYGGGGFGTYSLLMEVENNKIKMVRVCVINI